MVATLSLSDGGRWLQVLTDQDLLRVRRTRLSIRLGSRSILQKLLDHTVRILLLLTLRLLRTLLLILVLLELEYLVV